MARSGATIREVAQKAGVSVGTASKAFNQTGSLAESTRQRVLAAATELHYTPNALIRSLQRGKTNSIGVLTWELTTNIFHDISMYLLKGIADGLSAAGYDILLYSRLPNRGNPMSPATFLDGRVDGVILGPEVVTESGLKNLAVSGLPIVLLYKEPSVASLGCVRIDNRAGIRQAIEHLVALGHRRIGFYAPVTSFDYCERREAYLQELERRGLPQNPAWLLTTDDFHAPVGPACDRLLALPEPPTALIAGDDSFAFLWIEELRQRHYRVPEDFSVIGFDDSLAAKDAPGLTTVRQSPGQVGQTAAEFLHRMIGGEPAENCRTVLPVEFIVRGTTAPPRLSLP